MGLIKDLFDFLPKPNRPASYGAKEGKYPFFTSSNTIDKFVDIADYDGEYLIVGDGGTANCKYYSGAFSASDHNYILKPLDGTNCKLVRYFLMKDNYKILSEGFKGVGIKNISKTYIQNINFSKNESYSAEEIVGSLSKIEQIIDSKNRELSNLDYLIKSRFIEMFGNVDFNEKNWFQCTLGEVCQQVKRYPTFCNMKYLESGVRVIRIGNILLDGRMETDDKNYVFVFEKANIDFPDTIIEKNDIIMAVRGDGSAAKRMGIITEDKLIGANISPNLIRIKANDAIILPMFLFYFLTGDIGQKRLDAYVNKTAKKNIAAKDIVKVLVPVPPINLQNDFIEFVKLIDKSKFSVQKEIELYKELLEKKMNEYFG